MERESCEKGERVAREGERELERDERERHKRERKDRHERERHER